MDPESLRSQALALIDNELHLDLVNTLINDATVTVSHYYFPHCSQATLA